MTEDARRRIPRTDYLLELVRSVQQQARDGLIAPEDTEAAVLAAAASAFRPASLGPVLNATGVVVHTNLGRAPLSSDAVAAVVAASGYTDVELDLATGGRSQRGAGALAALRRACPAAEDALVVNNGAAALVLATTALASGREVVISKGELVEIGAGFRLADLIESTGVRLREVGATNRTHLRDYLNAIGPNTGCVLKVHPSNFRVEGFTSQVSLSELRAAVGELPIVADLGSGLLHPEPALPGEPDATSALRSGADLVVASGDKLLGGPQAGLLLGRAPLIARLSKHPLARAGRVDKLTLAALEATLSGSETPVRQFVTMDPDRLKVRTEQLASALNLPVVSHDGRVGGGGAPGFPLMGWAVELPESAASRLRCGDPAVLPRLRDGHCLLDLRCVPEAEDGRLLDAVRQSLES